MTLPTLLNDAQLKSEIARCESCEEKGCKDGCPANCSPADFIMSAKLFQPQDFQRAAAEIMSANPVGGICGAVCPDRFCQAKCVHKKFDRPVEIPAVQATIIAKAKALGVMPKLAAAPKNGKKVAVVGAGPAGVAAALYLAQKGYEVTVLEKGEQTGGACNLIPKHRLDPEILESDFAWALKNANIALKTGMNVEDPAALLKQGFEAVVVAIGLWSPYTLGIPGEDKAVAGLEYLKNPGKFPMKGKVAVVGGGATAVDCAVTAKRAGADQVEMFALEKLSEMPLTSKELHEVMEHGVQVTGRTKLTAIEANGSIKTAKVSLPDGAKFELKAIKDVAGSEQVRTDVQHVIVAIGARASQKKVDHKAVFYAGDCETGPSTVVEASAMGKNAAAKVDVLLAKAAAPKLDKDRPRKSFAVVPGYRKLPVSLETDFFGRKLISPVLLSAAPPSDGYEPMKKAYQAGWAGGIMKTSFDNVPIHIPADYFIAFDQQTWGNCDNVSGHPLDRVCREIGQLIKEYPDRLTAASTGGPVTGKDEHDKKGWQSNTKKLEASGVMAIEYSLSCPQGGDGTEGDIVSQNAKLTAKIIDWVLEAGQADVPKLFKLTAAVTSIAVIIKAIKEVFAKHPGKKAGVTLANTFPTLGFRDWNKRGKWDEAIVFGMSGGGVIPISYLTLASVGNLGVFVSGNGGAMDYKQVADFLALGCGNVQMCTAPMKYGYGYVSELHEGLSHLMAARGFKSVKELIGCALPSPVTGFMELTPKKRISSVVEELCMSCGNCSRCSYGAITLDANRHPTFNAEMCVGCSICTQKCFSGALRMRERTAQELAMLKES
ncbi:MAG TPA: FAD-dependent oxidoreductase [Myxococcales bacterium]|jgi:NADPH-dependent glutamate synthase beta subunit-like oxidoreductase/dihydroorotate dehydrogenase